MTEKVEKIIFQDLAALSPTPILSVYSYSSLIQQLTALKALKVNR